MRSFKIGRGTATVAALALLAGAAPAGWAQTGTDQTGPSSRSTAMPESGVIRPPGVQDPGMRKTPPAEAETMPVIPPPGTPGNSGNVVPK